MSNALIPAILQSFLNLEVEVTKNTNARRELGDALFKIAANDKTIKALEEAAKKHGMTLEVCFPQTELSYGYRLDRLSVTIDKAANDRWMIARMDIG